jgi:hypothetical protein
MKAWHFLAALVLFLGVVTYMDIRQRSDNREVMEAVDAAKAEQLRLVNADSIQSKVEASIMAKLKDSLDARDKQIKQLKTDLIKTRKRNEELYTLYRSLAIDMPEF